jgi:DNA-binding winged helix-turn-helix (wHTH) protein
MSGSLSTARQPSFPEKGSWEHHPRYHAQLEAENPSDNSLANSRAAPHPERINGSTARAISFGLFRLLPAQRLLLRADKAVPLGSRALDILIVLVERPGELLGKGELMARVWPNTFVEPANLAVQLVALRRALGDGCDGNRFIINIPGRGYQFVAAVTLAADL